MINDVCSLSLEITKFKDWTSPVIPACGDVCCDEFEGPLWIPLVLLCSWRLPFSPCVLGPPSSSHPSPSITVASATLELGEA